MKADELPKPWLQSGEQIYRYLAIAGNQARPPADKRPPWTPAMKERRAYWPRPR
jgi:hypothetical protein